MCSYFLMLEIESFASLKNEYCLFGRGYILRGGGGAGGCQVLQNFEAWLLIKGGGGSGRFRIVFRGDR